MLVIWQVLLGLLLLLGGGESLVRGAVAVAERLGLSPLVIGVTLVGFGTSAPELATSIDAALVGAPGIAVGNVVGSNIANVLLILGTGALCYPIACQTRAFRRDAPALLAATVLCVVIILMGQIGRPLGLLLLAILVAYLVATTLDDRRQMEKQNIDMSAAERQISLPLNLVLLLAGLGGILLGADLLVRGAIGLAERFGVSDTVIGLTIVAIGTSLPELVTAVIASLKRQGEMAFGNVIGSNIFNILGILGATAVVTPLAIPADVAGIDAWIMLGATVVVLIFAYTHRRISRTEGALLLAGYVAYLVVRTWMAVG